MALIKCPECKKKISDTVDKCLQCGFSLENISKDEMRIKEFKFDKRLIKRIVIVIVLLLIAFLGYGLIFSLNGNINKAINHLESEGYECEKEASPLWFENSGRYICYNEDSDGNKKEYIVEWYSGIVELISDIENGTDLFDDSIDIVFYFYNDDESAYLYIDSENISESYGYVMQDEETSEHLCLYVTEGSTDDNHIALGDRYLKVDYSNCQDDYDNYLDEINDSLDDIRDFLDEMDMD